MSLHSKIFPILLTLSSTCCLSFAQAPCDESTMDAFAYEDCIAAQNGKQIDETDFSEKSSSSAASEEPGEVEETLPYSPFFDKGAYFTSSFGENRGTRYHAGIDYSTNMEEGWPIMAPEDGYVKELHVSPFGYGKVMYYQGKSGKTWVFAHQSSFGKLDEQIKRKQYSSKKNDVSIKSGTRFKRGDTLTFSGSTGIGNPHLHLEVRKGSDKVLSPVSVGAIGQDTIAPQIFGVAVWQGNELAVTSDNAFSMGCATTPVKNEFNLSMAIKIADYSREPKDNPMSIRRIEMWRYDEKIYSKVMDSLSYKKMLNIRDELLWAEEADTAGDWHYIKARIAPLSTYRLEIEDFAGHVTTRKFNFHPKCRNNIPLLLTKSQTTPIYTFLSRPMLDMYRCDLGYKFTALDEDGDVINDDLCMIFDHDKPLLLAKVAETYPTIKSIRYTVGAENTNLGRAINETIELYQLQKYKSSVNWTTKVGEAKISQTISKIPVTSDTSVRVLAVTKSLTDSLDYFEFHPKGMQFYGKWNVCIDNPVNRGPLYWLGESTRNWFYFSKQSNGKKRCASTNEIRDIANINNEERMTLGFPYWADSYINGLSQPVLKIPLVFKYTGVASGNAITVKSKNKWIAAEFDSETHDIIIASDVLPEAGETLTIQVTDEANRKMTQSITVPGM